MADETRYSRRDAALIDLERSLANGEVVGCGDLEFQIDRAGQWSYRGSPIGRQKLVKLFASILHRAPDGTYWLVTPVERGTVEVEDVPFVAVGLTTDGIGRNRRISLRTNLDDEVRVGPDHPLRLGAQPDGSLAPYVTVRGGLEARLGRSVYYELIDLGSVETIDGRAQFGVWSDGTFFRLGELEPAAEL